MWPQTQPAASSAHDAAIQLTRGLIVAASTLLPRGKTPKNPSAASYIHHMMATESDEQSIFNPTHSRAHTQDRKEKRAKIEDAWAKHYKPRSKRSNAHVRGAVTDLARVDLADWLASCDVHDSPSGPAAELKRHDWNALPQPSAGTLFSCPAPEDHDEVRRHALKPLGDDVAGIITTQTKERLAKRSRNGPTKKPRDGAIGPQTPMYKHPTQALVSTSRRPTQSADRNQRRTPHHNGGPQARPHQTTKPGR